MTEAEWAACPNPEPMLDFLAGRVSERKLILFAVASGRRVWTLMTDPSHRRIVEAAEGFADGLMSEAEFQQVLRPVFAGWGQAPDMTAAVRGVLWALRQLGPAGSRPHGREEAQAILLRDVMGSPFQPAPRADDHQLRNDGLVRRLAEAAYEERLLPSGHLDRVRLAVLADALEEGGAGPVLLDHLRQSGGVHVRGCWVLDLLLRKE